MSRHRIYGERSRFDSALDLSSAQTRSSYDDSEDSQTFAAGSVMAPWSQYNPRYEPGPMSSYLPSDLSPYPYTIHEPSPLDYASQAFLGASSPIEPIPLSPSSAASPPSYSSSPSSSLPRPSAFASTATTYSTMPNSNHHDNNNNNIITCGQCNIEFRGSYRRGNLKRHMGQKHGEAKGGPKYTCLAEGCFSSFQRSDARLKHARNKHPELNFPPLQKRHGTEHGAVGPHVYMAQDIDVAQDPPYNVGQWLQAEQGFIGNHISKLHDEVDPSAGVEEMPRAAQCVFTTLQRNLHPRDYSRVCDSFFTRWESIVQQLKDNQSSQYLLYAKVVEDIQAVVQAIDVAAYVSCDEGSSNYRSRAPSTKWAGSRGSGHSGLNHYTGSAAQTDRVFKQSGRKRPQASGSGKNVLVVTNEHAVRTESRKVDCPVHKHNVMHGITPTCSGCSVGVMAQVRSHLNPDRAGTHGDFPEFIAQCSRCKQDFVEQNVYDAHIGEGCTSQPQTRNDIVIAWARQYLALYPDAQQIPIPWTDENGWLPDSEVRRCRASLTFLGERQGRSNSQLHTPHVTEPPDEPRYRNVMGHVLGDILNPVFIQPTRSPTPTYNEERQAMSNLQTPPVSTPASTNRYFLIIVNTFRANQSAIRRGAAHLTAEQLRYMVEECEMMLNIACGMYQQHSSQSTQVQATPAIDYGSASDEANYTACTTPLRPHYTSYGGDSPFVTPGPSTQPSSSGYDTGSSRRMDTPLTQTSSISDPRYLTPDSSTSCRLPHRLRRTSELSPITQETVQMRRGYSHRSLPEDPFYDESDTRYYNSSQRPPRRR